jgi:hypothetical protein
MEFSENRWNGRNQQADDGLRMRPSSFSKPRQDDVVEVGNYLGEDRLKVTNW